MAQIIALARHGNKTLCGEKVKPFKKDFTARICDEIHFEAGVKGKHETVAKDADSWLAALKKKGCSGLRLLHNDGDWAIEALMPEGQSQCWQAKWDEEGERPRVTYQLTAMGDTQPSDAPSVEEVSKALEKVLIDIHAFAEQHKCEPFVGHFASALKALRKGNLHDACSCAWVFGGMGSWNDIGFGGADGDDYDRLSRQLRDAIIAGYIACASE